MSVVVRGLFAVEIGENFFFVLIFVFGVSEVLRKRAMQKPSPRVLWGIKRYTGRLCRSERF